MRRTARIVIALALATLGARAASAQPTLAGRWTGSVATPSGPLAIELAFEARGGRLSGRISISDQGVAGRPLAAISQSGREVAFDMRGVPGAPRFLGQMSADGAGITGTLAQSGVTYPFTVTRVAAPAAAEMPRAAEPIASPAATTTAAPQPTQAPLPLAPAFTVAPVTRPLLAAPPASPEVAAPREAAAPPAQQPQVPTPVPAPPAVPPLRRPTPTAPPPTPPVQAPPPAPAPPLQPTPPAPPPTPKPPAPPPTPAPPAPPTPPPAPPSAPAPAPAAIPPASAEPASPTPISAAGHWEGAIEVPGRPVTIAVDLYEDDGLLSGDISIPQQGVDRLALSGFEQLGDEIAFELPHQPGDPVFRGVLTGDGRSIAGRLTQQGLTFPFRLTRSP